MKRLQVFKNNEWRYVFCRDQWNQIATTEHKEKALRGYHIDFFTEKFANNQFRVVK